MTKTKSVYFTEALCSNPFAEMEIHLVPQLKLLSVLVKSLSRLVLHLTSRKFHLMIVMALVVVRECKPLRFQYPVMASCNKDRLSFLLFLTVSLCHAKFRLYIFRPLIYPLWHVNISVKSVALHFLTQL